MTTVKGRVVSSHHCWPGSSAPCAAGRFGQVLDDVRPLARHGDAAAEACVALGEAAALAAAAIGPHRSDRSCCEDHRCELCILRDAWDHARAAVVAVRFALATATDRRRLTHEPTCAGECEAR